MTLSLNSSAFKNGDRIPSQYTCHGTDISPPLTWKNAPAGTQSFVLILDDPDAPAGVWDHWILYNIPATTQELTENISQLPTGTQVGRNSYNKTTYNGPCPPDREHRYQFKLYALNSILNLPDGASKAQVENAMEDHVLGSVMLMGRVSPK